MKSYNGSVKFQLIDGIDHSVGPCFCTLWQREFFSTLWIPKASKDMHEHFKMNHRLFDVVDRPNKKLCMTKLQYSVDMPENSYAQVWYYSKNMG